MADVNLALQYVLIALAVLWSLAYVVRRQWPGAVRRARGRAALWLLRDARAPWMKRIGRKLAPPARTGVPVACVGCTGCEPS